MYGTYIVQDWRRGIVKGEGKVELGKGEEGGRGA